MIIVLMGQHYKELWHRHKGCWIEGCWFWGCCCCFFVGIFLVGQPFVLSLQALVFSPVIWLTGLCSWNAFIPACIQMGLFRNHCGKIPPNMAAIQITRWHGQFAKTTVVCEFCNCATFGSVTNFCLEAFYFDQHQFMCQSTWSCNRWFYEAERGALKCLMGSMSPEIPHRMYSFKFTYVYLMSHRTSPLHSFIGIHSRLPLYLVRNKISKNR